MFGFRFVLYHLLFRLITILFIIALSIALTFGKSLVSVLKCIQLYPTPLSPICSCVVCGNNDANNSNNFHFYGNQKVYL